jgi:hypothetical protein
MVLHSSYDVFVSTLVFIAATFGGFVFNNLLSLPFAVLRTTSKLGII